MLENSEKCPSAAEDDGVILHVLTFKQFKPQIYSITMTQNRETQQILTFEILNK